MRSLVALCWFSPAHSWRLPPPTLRRSHPPVAELTEGDTLLTGECLWFNTLKGFGFIKVDGDEEQDLFVHYNDVHADGFQSLAEGERLEFVCTADAQGRLRATSVTGPDGSYVLGAPAPIADAARIYLAGTCKWWNSDKRFGFIDITGEDADIFCHYRDLHAAPGVEASLAEGEVVEFRRSIGPEGKERAVEVTGPDGAYVQGRSQVTTSERLTGKVRWFDVAKGCGFIDVDDQEEDAFVQ